MTTRSRALVMMLLIATLMLGCERKPEDLEKWRNAEGGMEKMLGWAKSEEESMAVRERAVQILVEQDQAGKIQQMLAAMPEGEERASLANAAVPSIEAMWAKKDYPVMDDATKENGGQVRVGESDSVKAKDAAYYIHPYATGEAQQKLEAILAEWLSTDHQLRDQLGRAKLAQILPNAGARGFDGMMIWFKDMDRPGMLARQIRESGDDETKDRLAEVIVERAEREHPNLSPEMQVVVLETESDKIVPYLERSIRDPKTEGSMADKMMDAFVRIQGPKATPLLSELVTKRADIMRWVAITRLIELRGTAGVLQAANALPLEIETWPTGGKHTIQKEADYFCNIVKTELAKQGVEDPKPTIDKLLKMKRWPAQTLALRCVEKDNLAELKPSVDAIVGTPQIVPGWGEEATTVGAIAEAVAAGL